MARSIQLVIKQAAVRKISVYLLIVSLCSVSTSSAQQTEDLAQQLQQLKKEYQHKLEELDQRLAALEAQRTTPAPMQAIPQPTSGQQSTLDASPSKVANAVGQGLKTAISGTDQ